MVYILLGLVVSLADLAARISAKRASSAPASSAATRRTSSRLRISSTTRRPPAHSPTSKSPSLFPAAAPTFPKAATALPDYVKQLREKGIKIVDSLEELADQSDAIMLESVDGRPHLKQFRAIAKGKPVFVDKPAAVSLADLLTIYRVADETHTPVFSSSSLRFVQRGSGRGQRSSRSARCSAAKRLSPMSYAEPTSRSVLVRHPRRRAALHDHGHRDAKAVSRSRLTDLSTVVVGKWKDGRIGSYRG